MRAKKNHAPKRLRTLVKYALGLTIVINVVVSMLMLLQKWMPSAGMLGFVILYTITFLFFPSIIALLMIKMDDFQHRRNIGFQLEKKLIGGVVLSVFMFFACSYLGFALIP